MDQLDEIGFVWEVKTKTAWDNRLEDLRQYKEKYGDCFVSTVDEEHKALGKWVVK